MAEIEDVSDSESYLEVPEENDVRIQEILNEDSDDDYWVPESAGSESDENDRSDDGGFGSDSGGRCVTIKWVY